MGSCDLTYNGEAEARTIGTPRYEGFEQAFAQSLRNAGAGIGDVEPYLCVIAPHRKPHASAGRRALDRVQDEVVERTSRLVTIQIDRAQCLVMPAPTSSRTPLAAARSR